MQNTKGTLYLTVGSLIFVLAAYLTNIYLGRTLGPEKYGVYGVIISILTIINLIQTSGLPQVLSKKIAENQDNIDKILSSTLFLQFLSSIVLATVLFVLSDNLSELFNDKRLEYYLQISSFSIPIYGLLVCYLGFYNGLHNFKKQAFLNIVYALGKLLLTVILTLKYQLNGAIYAFTISSLLGLIPSIYFPKNNISKTLVKKILILSLPFIFFALSLTLLQNVDLLFVKGILKSDYATGLYTANQNITRILYFGLGGFALTIFPIISASTTNRTIKDTQNTISNSIRMFLILLIPATLLLMTTNQSILELLFTKNYLPGSSSLTILILGISFLTFTNLLTNILNGASFIRQSILTIIISLFITTILCLYLIPVYQLNGAAIATTIGSFVSMIFSAYLVYQHFKVLVSTPVLLKISIASVVVSTIAYITIVPIVLLPFLYLILFILYIGLLILMKEITYNELAIIRNKILIKYLPIKAK